MKYFVIATCWNDEKEEAEFDSYMNASIFRDAYDKYYSTYATIVEDFELLNQ